jgi:hypothetical protein
MSLDLTDGRSESGTGRAGNALQIHVKSRHEEAPGHVVKGATARVRRRLSDMSALLTTRLHVDLQRVSSAICS